MYSINNPGRKVHGANMGPIWGRQESGGPHVVTMHFARWEPLIKIQEESFSSILVMVNIPNL